uniref:EH domain-binding protein 1-like n=1 Tax=Ciona intestinalis TaxID=7719 RepID=UPI0005214D0C|nr:EH domain-binding protein 1-like [Ciona intestinalis]|eukprot:XP_009858493.1 EH domain-binding protein 1-like [Ciona intestinalis]
MNTDSEALPIDIVLAQLGTPLNKSKPTKSIEKPPKTVKTVDKPLPKFQSNTLEVSVIKEEPKVLKTEPSPSFDMKIHFNETEVMRPKVSHEQKVSTYEKVVASCERTVKSHENEILATGKSYDLNNVSQEETAKTSPTVKSSHGKQSHELHVERDEVSCELSRKNDSAIDCVMKETTTDTSTNNKSTINANLATITTKTDATKTATTANLDSSTTTKSRTNSNSSTTLKQQSTTTTTTTNSDSQTEGNKTNVSNEDLQGTIDKLLRSSAERSKRTKTNELIEKAKAEALSSKVAKPSNQRQAEVRARALRLLDETRASLSTKEEPTHSNLTSPTNSGSSSASCSTNALNGSTNLTTEPAASSIITSPNITPSPVSLEPTPKKASNTPPSPLNSSGAQPTLDSGFFPDSETPTSSDPLQSLPTVEISSGVKTDTSIKHKSNHNSAENVAANDKQPNSTPQSSVKGILKKKVSKTADTDDAGGFPDNNKDTISPIPIVKKRDHSSKVTDRLSVASISELHRRWSTVLKKKAKDIDVIDELENDRLALEEEMKNVEERSREVQLELQSINESGHHRSHKERETLLTQEWFQLVHKKNAILREQDQLILMEEDQSINRRIEKIHEELIPLMAIEDIMKTVAQKEREHLLLEEKFKLVNDRDRINQEMNEKEQLALEEEERLQTSLGQNMPKVVQQDEKCLVM